MRKLLAALVLLIPLTAHAQVWSDPLDPPIGDDQSAMRRDFQRGQFEQRQRDLEERMHRMELWQELQALEPDDLTPPETSASPWRQ